MSTGAIIAIAVAAAIILIALLVRSEEHTSELQSLRHLVCRLLLEKKKNEPTTAGLQRSRLVYRRVCVVSPLRLGSAELFEVRISSIASAFATAWLVLSLPFPPFSS